MSVSNEDTDDLVDRAVREIRTKEEEGERSNVAVKARELGVHKDRIYQRLKDIGSYIGRKSTDRKLSVIQEDSLIRYISSLNEIGYSIRYNQINNVVNVILLQNHTITVSTFSVDLYWTRRFLDRHSKLYKIKQKSLELKQKLVHDSGVILN